MSNIGTFIQLSCAQHKRVVDASFRVLILKIIMILKLMLHQLFFAAEKNQNMENQGDRGNLNTFLLSRRTERRMIMSMEFYSFLAAFEEIISDTDCMSI